MSATPLTTGDAQQIVNDVTGLNPVPVWAVVTPTSTEDIRVAIKRTSGAICIGGGRFSMGGQTASPGALHIDMRRMNGVVSFSPLHRTIRVQAGIRWCDLQRFLDPHDLSIKIMQSYANFTVGGSLSVNVHGRYMGQGPLILAVRSILIVLASGESVEASPSVNSELFYGAIGGYGGLGVIVEAELDLARNTRVKRVTAKLPANTYLAHFTEKVRNAPRAIFHNADLYPPQFTRARSITWEETDDPVTVPYRLVPTRRTYPLQKYFIWAISETPLGKWRKEYLIDPLLYSSKRVHWRNYEAGADVAELEPRSRVFRTFVLQEYFVPVERYQDFVTRMAEILQRHRVNVLNISVRHAAADPGSLLAWARGETFAFVLYYKQRTRVNARNRVAVWTRELIDAAIECSGAYYLPYQVHATPEQFHKAYPRAQELFALKRRLDPDFRWRNVIWDTYYAPTLAVGNQPVGHAAGCEFHRVFDDRRMHDGFYRFLQNIYRLYPEDRFHALIKAACAEHKDDEAIYRQLQRDLPGIKPMLSELTYAVPALLKQKREMARQTLQLLGDRRSVHGYVEIGTTGRYISELRKHVRVEGDIVLVNDVAPGGSPVDVVERGQIGKLGRFVPMNDYAPIAETDVASASVDVVTCYIGLHHAQPERLHDFILSIERILRPGGVLILRDHDVTTPLMHDFVSLAHTVFNAGLGLPWETNRNELRFFAPVASWSERLQAAGLIDSGNRLLQANDPSDNVLMSFVKASRERAA
ncbi:FAD-binding protein [Rhodanobacter sp. C03]|uniref:FAD-binding protein n=1 Tax=Rhodanobacter sp. C03 TaxID=1945858 RepID=UPI000985F81F|nr:FAD-binding protein [Rhodanobacter sp. C03]OOG53283.1 FAD-binding oxidoreductase [Rhodanobacter sp. C03]